MMYWMHLLLWNSFLKVVWRSVQRQCDCYVLYKHQDSLYPVSACLDIIKRLLDIRYYQEILNSLNYFLKSFLKTDKMLRYWPYLIAVTKLGLQCLFSHKFLPGCSSANFVLCYRISNYQGYCPPKPFKIVL